MKMKALEDELHEDTVEETDKEASSPHKNSQKEGRNANIFKCEMCEFTTRRAMTYNKHMNTKHPVEPDCKEDATESSDEGSEEESDIDLFSFEVVGEEIVCVCNLCNTEIDNENELSKHMKEKHDRSVQFDKKFDKWTDCKRRDCGICMECSIDNYQ